MPQLSVWVCTCMCHCSYSLLSWKNRDAISANNILCVGNVDSYIEGIPCVDLCKGCGMHLHLFRTICHLEFDGKNLNYKCFTTQN